MPSCSVFCGRSLVFSLPHFFTPEYLVQSQPSQLACGAGADACEAEDGGSSDVSGFLYVFLLAQILHGLGAAPLWSLGVAYIDANVKKKLVSVSCVVVEMGERSRGRLSGPIGGFRTSWFAGPPVLPDVCTALDFVTCKAL